MKSLKNLIKSWFNVNKTLKEQGYDYAMKEISLFGNDCIKRLEIESLGFDERSDFDEGIICALIEHETKK